MGNLFVLIPTGTSVGVINSQLISRFKLLNSAHVLFVGSNENVLISREVEGILPWRKFISCLLNSGHQDIVYTRSAQQCVLVLLMKWITKTKFRVSFDLRGFQAEESSLRRGRKGWRHYLLDTIERFAIKKSDTVSCVSNCMSQEIFERYGRTGVVVIPCCLPIHKVVHRQLPSTRQSTRQSSRSLRFAYIGSVASWQCFSDAVSLFRRIDGPKELVVVTPNLSDAIAVLEEYGVKARVLSGGWDLVRSVLDESDFGFVLRGNNVVNRTASPIKFLEYTARGVVPIISPYVGDYSVDFSSVSITVEEGCEYIPRHVFEEILNQYSFDSMFDLTAKHTWDEYRDVINKLYSF